MLANPLYARAYDGFLRYGSTCNTLREGSDGAGGFLVPDEFENKIVRAMKQKNILRQLATTMTTNRNWKIPVAVGDGHAYWVPEEGPFPVESTTFDQLEMGAYKLATMTLVTDELLEDSVFDIEDFIADEFAMRLANAEEDAFLHGDGDGKPLGLTRQLESVVTTENAGIIQIEDLLELQYAIPEPYRDNAVFLMSDAAVRELCKIRSAFDRNIWEGDMCKDVPVKLLGKQVIVCDALPAPESGSMPILYGDFSRYVIGDREHRSVKRLNELYARQGQVAYLISQRVDATLMDKRAIAGLKIR